MKNLILLFLVLFCFNFGFTQGDSSPSPEIFINGNFAFSHIENFDAPIAYGIGTEAKINEKFSIGGSFNYGTSDLYRRIIINPNVKFYPKKVFKGFFLTSGISYSQLEAKNKLPLGYPFDTEKDSEVSFFSLNVGLGLSTLVKDRWYIGVSVALATSPEVESAMIESNFTVGYGF